MRKILFILLSVFGVGHALADEPKSLIHSIAARTISVFESKPSFANVELGLPIEKLSSESSLKSCVKSDGVHEDDVTVGIVIFNCVKIHESVETAKLTFFNGKLLKADFFIPKKDGMQERVRRAFLQKFGTPDEDVSRKQLSTAQYPAEAFSIPAAFNTKGIYEKWKKSGWLAYAASIRDEMFFVRLIDKDANDRLVEKLKKLDAEKSKKDLKDLNI